MRFSFVVFDFDGTLVDSQSGIVSAMQVAFARHGLAAPAAEAVRRMVGLRLDQAVTALLRDKEARELVPAVADAYRQSFSDQRNRGLLQEPLFPGAREAIEQLDRAGVLLGIATGKSRRGLLHALERHDLRGFFVTLQAAEDGPSKPHPELLERAMAEAGATPGETVMVGDTTYDMEMAGRAGATAIGVGWGYHPDEQLRRHGAERVVAHFRDLPPAVVAKREVST